MVGVLNDPLTDTNKTRIDVSKLDIGKVIWAHPHFKCACLLNIKHLADDSKPTSLAMMKSRINLSEIRHPKAQTLLVVMVMKQSW